MFYFKLMKTSELIFVFVILLSFSILTGVILGILYKTDYGNIAVIKITGEISNDASIFSSGTSAQEIIEELEEVKYNPLIQAVILDINSGGGSSVACAELVRAVKELDKPVISLIRDVGASGAYWIASATDYIIAHDLSLLGSIGVSMEYLEFSGLLERFNVSYVNLSYPEHKNIFSQYRPLTDTELNWTMKWLEHAYDYFLTSVSNNRNMTKEEMTPYANGSVFMGYEALNYGLIDELGGFPEALNKTIELANITEPILIKYEQTYNILDLIQGITGENEARIKI